MPGWSVWWGLLLLVWIGVAQAVVPVDINRADAATLQQGLAMVGPSRAAAIVQYRQQHGPFRSVEDLAQVKGIGKGIVERNRQRIILGDMTSRRNAVPGAVPVRSVPRR